MNEYIQNELIYKTILTHQNNEMFDDKINIKIYYNLLNI